MPVSASLKMADWKGLTLQSNFTYSKALGTGALVQATGGYTPDDPFNLGTMYGNQTFNRKFVYNFSSSTSSSLRDSQGWWDARWGLDVLDGLHCRQRFASRTLYFDRRWSGVWRR